MVQSQSKTYRKGQIWMLDLIAAVTVFSILMIIYITFTNNLLTQNKAFFGDVYNDVNIISDTLMSSGSPANWTPETITAVGITNGNYRLNWTKLNYTSQMNYSSLKMLLKTRYDYVFFFENRNNELMNISGNTYIGKQGINKTNIREVEDIDTLISTRRYLIYNSSIISMVIYAWD